MALAAGLWAGASHAVLVGYTDPSLFEDDVESLGDLRTEGFDSTGVGALSVNQAVGDFVFTSVGLPNGTLSINDTPPPFISPPHQLGSTNSNVDGLLIQNSSFNVSFGNAFAFGAYFVYAGLPSLVDVFELQVGGDFGFSQVFRNAANGVLIGGSSYKYFVGVIDDSGDGSITSAILGANDSFGPVQFNIDDFHTGVSSVDVSATLSLMVAGLGIVAGLRRSRPNRLSSNMSVTY